MIGLEGETLRLKRLTYRLLEPSDLDALSELLSDKSGTETAGFMPASSKEGFNDFFATLTHYHTGIAILSDETLIGYRYVPNMPEYCGKNCVSMGLAIGKKYQNRGYATETPDTITAYLKQSFDYCVADHFSGDEFSKRVIKKCGYRYLETYSLFFDELGKEITCLSYIR